MLDKMLRVSQIVGEYQPVIPSPLRVLAFKIMMKIKRLHRTPFRFVWNGLPFKGRITDFYGSISDVFLEHDYVFITPVLHAITGHPLIIDAGANVGAFAVYCLSIRDDAVIHSIEPAADTFRLLAANAAPLPTWHAHQIALWSEDGTVAFETDQTISAGSHIHVQGGKNTYTVPAARLGTFVAQHIGEASIDILKMDIEGAEQMVLSDAEHILDRVQHLIIEIHPHSVDEAHVMALIQRHFSAIKTIKRSEAGFVVVFASKLSA